MEKRAHNREAYLRVSEAFKKQRNGATVADIVAGTALPLQTVREFAPQVADEYSARLEVTESGEIRYSFPHGFTSKYRGFKANLRKFFDFSKKTLKKGATFIFKAWIMIMLLGYFAFFMLIALASLVLSVTVNSSSNSNNRSSRRGDGIGGMYLASSIFNTIIRMWFYSELFRTADPYYSGKSKPKKSRPLHKAIFSFIFGDGDTSREWESRKKKGVIAYIQANRGVISLPEFISITGMPLETAEGAITSYCVEFGGSPEATPEGTVVYRFDDLLLRDDMRDRSFSGLSAPMRALKQFSSNLKKMNVAFSVINGINLVFGGYFLFNAVKTGAIITQGQFNAASRLYGITYLLASEVISNPLPAIQIGLGLVPIVFSIFFWLIPALRYARLKKDNEGIKLENFRKLGFRAIWQTPLTVKPRDIAPEEEAMRPRNLAQAQDRIIKEAGAYASPDVSIDDDGAELYSFPEIVREKDALTQYRKEMDGGDLGKTVFDTET